MASRVRLELATDDAFQHMEWRIQRIGWLVWAMLLLAALLGLTGSGWLSGAEVTSDDGAVTVKYDRFLHYHKPTQLQIGVKSSDDANGRWQLKITRSLLDRLQISRIEPEPDRREIAHDGIVYTFLHSAGAPAGTIIFHLEYERYGTAQGTIALTGSRPVELNLFVFP
jgi:hypothetical protein